MSIVRIMNWGHRRALAPLEAMKTVLRARHRDVSLEIAERSLGDFEHQGIDSVARAYDLIVFDHPFCGTIAATGCFVSLDELLSAELGLDADRLYAGPSLATYRFAGKVWGAPIDAATQHAVYRADLLSAAGADVPVKFDDVIALGKALRHRGQHLALAVKSPHALATVASYMANEGKPWLVKTDGSLRFDRQALERAYDRVAEILSYCPGEAIEWNSIDLHEQMIARDDLVYCPAVYGYATYGEPDMRRRLAFAAFPGTEAPFEAGTMIGGTALGLSRYSRNRENALKVVAVALDAHVQSETFAFNHGQPARIEGWDSSEVDRQFNGYFSSVRRTLDHAWTRPRSVGYPHFQAAAGDAIAAGLAGRKSRSQAIDTVISLGAAVGG